MASTTPVPGSRADGGSHTPTSSGETTAPRRTGPSVPAGSQMTPDGTPNMTTARAPSPSRARLQAIHGPAHANAAASATGTSPTPRSASHAGSTVSSSGTSDAGAPTIMATH